MIVWSCIGYKGFGRLIVIDRNMDSVTYTRILSTELHESANFFELNGDFVFQQDNAPCHKCNYMIEFFEEK